MPKQSVAILAAASVLGLVCNSARTPDRPSTPRPPKCSPGRATLAPICSSRPDVERDRGLRGLRRPDRLLPRPDGQLRPRCAPARGRRFVCSAMRAITRETGRVSDRILTGTPLPMGDLTREAYAAPRRRRRRGVREPGSWAWHTSSMTPRRPEALGDRRAFRRSDQTETQPVLDDQTRPLWSNCRCRCSASSCMLIARRRNRRWIRSAIDPELIRAQPIERTDSPASTAEHSPARPTPSPTHLLAAQELWRADPSGIGLDARRRPPPAAP